MKPLIKVSAPTRIDLAGGTLDIPPLFLLHQPAFTINLAVDLQATVTIQPKEGPRITLIARDRRRRRTWPSLEAISWKGEPYLELVARLIRSFEPRGGIEVVTDCQAPAGAGIGGSSALAVAATAALSRLTGRRLLRPALIAYARGVETQTLKVPTGYQDYYASAYGGLNILEFDPGGIRRIPFQDRNFLTTLEEHLLLVYTGTPRFSGMNNWMLFKRRLDGDRMLFRFFEELKENALAMKEAVLAKDLPAIARAFNRDWRIRRRMLPTMSTPLIDTLIRKALKNGALAARVCGAGGGGCVAFLIDPEAGPRLRELAESLKVRILPSPIQRKGLVFEEGR